MLFDLAPHGVYLAVTVTRHAGRLLPHRFTLTVTTNGDEGGFLSVALSVDLRLSARRLAVSERAVLRSSDFPPPR